MPTNDNGDSRFQNGRVTRRRTLAAIAAASSVGIAGCSSDSDGGDGGDGSDGSDGGDGGDGSDGNDGGDDGDGSDGGDGLYERLMVNPSSVEWANDVNEQIPPAEVETIVWQNQGGKDGDPAMWTHANRYAEEVGIQPEGEIIPSAEMVTKTRANLQAQKKVPDVYQLFDMPLIQLGVDGNFDRPEPFMSTSDAWIPAAQQVANWPVEGINFDDFPYPDGLYLVPWQVDAWVLFANMDVLEEAGLPRDYQPESYQDMMDACATVQDAGITDTPVLMPFQGTVEGYAIFQDLVARADGHYFDANGNPDFENDGFVTALDFFLTLIQEGYMPKSITSLSEGQTTTRFFEGDAAFMMNATGNLLLPGKDLPIDKPGWEAARYIFYPNPEDVGLMDTPTGNAKINAQGVSVFSERKAVAADFVNFCATQQEQAEELLQEGNMPVRADVFELDRVQEEFPYVDFARRHLDGLTKLVVNRPAEVNQVVFDGVTNAIANDQSADQAAANIQQNVERIF